MAKMKKKRMMGAKKATMKVKKISSINKAYSKSEIAGHIADSAEITTKQAKAAIEAVYCLIEAHLKKSGPGKFVLPGMLKFQLVRKPATKARKGVNPFTGEPTTFKAKPARNVVKVRALKKLKAMVA